MKFGRPLNVFAERVRIGIARGLNGGDEIKTGSSISCNAFMGAVSARIKRASNMQAFGIGEWRS